MEKIARRLAWLDDLVLKINLALCGSLLTVMVVVAALGVFFRFVLHASCGERRLAGEYHLVVRDGRVVDAGPTRLVRFTHLRLSDFPTLADLLAKADHAEPDAVVDLHVDDSGIPSYLSIDHDPAAIDDEECYRVTGVRRLGE